MTRSGDGGETAPSSAPERRRRQEPSPTQRALGLLVRREHSVRELQRKLVARGVEADEAQTAIGKLTEHGWQSDARFAESLLRSRVASGYGPRWIRAELETHGLGSEIITAAMEDFTGNWVEIARDLLHRRHPLALAGDRDVQRKAADFLLRRGFGMEHVRAALE